MNKNLKHVLQCNLPNLQLISFKNCKLILIPALIYLHLTPNFNNLTTVIMDETNCDIRAEIKGALKKCEKIFRKVSFLGYTVTVINYV